MDIGAAVGGRNGTSPAKLAAIANWRTSGVFDTAERAALELADALCATPANVGNELYARLEAAFSSVQLVELTNAIAWENYRARFNRVFECESENYSDGAVCLTPPVQKAA